MYTNTQRRLYPEPPITPGVVVYHASVLFDSNRRPLYNFIYRPERCWVDSNAVIQIAIGPMLFVFAHFIAHLLGLCLTDVVCAVTIDPRVINNYIHYIMWDEIAYPFPNFNSCTECITLDISLPHDDVIKWKHFQRYWPFVRGIHRSRVNSPHNMYTPVTRSFDVFFDLRLNKRLSKQSWGWWFETPPRQLWRHCNDLVLGHLQVIDRVGTIWVYFVGSVSKCSNLSLTCCIIYRVRVSSNTSRVDCISPEIEKK